MEKKKSLRNEMPETAEFIDFLREAFGRECIDDILRRAMHGEPNTFFAEENGLTFGTPRTPFKGIGMTWDPQRCGLVDVEDKDV